MKKQTFGALLKQKQGFLLSTYGLLIGQLVLTFAIVYVFRNSETVDKITNQSIFIYLFLTLGLLLILAFVPMPSWLKLIVFGLFAIVMGGLLHKSSRLTSKESVDNALRGTIAIFVIMTIIGVCFAAMGVDLSWAQLLLIAGFIGLFVASLLVLIFSPKSTLLHKAILIVTLILVSCYVMVFTNAIIMPGYKNDYIDAAISFYIDFVNVYSALLGLDNL